MRKILSLLSLPFLLLPCAEAQEVWPGDVNNNGKVTGVDLLYWGLAFGAEGPARSVESTDWSAQPVLSLWGSTFPSGLDFSYADCNGDGRVDEDDFSEAIEDNFGLEHPPVGADSFANGQGNAPRLRLSPSATLVEEGAMVNIGLSLESTNQPLDSFYGLALKISYTTGLLEGDDGPDFDLMENSWIEIDESYVQELYVDDDGAGTAELAITRTNQLAIATSNGQFGSFSIIVEDIIVGLEIDTFILRIDSVLLIDQHFGITPVVPDTVQIIIAKDTSKLTTTDSPHWHFEAEKQVVIYPNPVKEIVYLNTALEIEGLTLVDQLGRTVILYAGSIPAGTYSFFIGDQLPGVYWLKIRTDKGIISHKLLISPG